MANGNVLFYIANIETRIKLEKSQKWLQYIEYLITGIFCKLYKMAVNKICLKYADLKDKKSTFRKIKKNNKLLYLRLKLINIK